jgi:hypothetical protein
MTCVLGDQVSSLLFSTHGSGLCILGFVKQMWLEASFPGLAVGVRGPLSGGQWDTAFSVQVETLGLRVSF